MASNVLAIEQSIWNGDAVTHPQYKKVSKTYKHCAMLDDSDVSEDYDADLFFEGNQSPFVPQLRAPDHSGAENSRRIFGPQATGE